MSIHRLLTLCVSCSLVVTAFAAEQIGPIHPIVEPDMLQEIYRVLNEKQKNGQLDSLQAQAIERAKHSIETPKPVAGLERTTKARTFYWDPTIRVANTVRDPEGNVIAQAGQTVNPLDYVSLPQRMLFFDGTDSQQVKQASAVVQQYNGQVKAIMVNGQPLELSRQWKYQVYFDQGGALVRRLGIEKVPSLVSQEGRKLRIDELEVK